MWKNLHLKWGALRLPPPSLHHQPPAWDPLRLWTWRPKSGRRGWRGPVFVLILQMMPLQFNSAFNISVLSCSSSPISVADTRTAGETEVYLSLLILQEFHFYTCTCLKFYLAVWGQPNSLGLRYVIHLEEASHLSLWPFSPLLMCRCHVCQGKEWFAGDCNRKTAEALLLRVKKVQNWWILNKKDHRTEGSAGGLYCLNWREHSF